MPKVTGRTATEFVEAFNVSYRRALASHGWPEPQPAALTRPHRHLGTRPLYRQDTCATDAEAITKDSNGITYITQVVRKLVSETGLLSK